MLRPLLLLAALASAAATTIEPDRPVWPQEYQVGRGGAPPAAVAAGPVAASGPSCVCKPSCNAFQASCWSQVSFDFEVPYIGEYQKSGFK